MMKAAFGVATPGAVFVFLDYLFFLAAFFTGFFAGAFFAVFFLAMLCTPLFIFPDEHFDLRPDFS